ncbi:MAG: FHA domain-containing protein [Planctomycetota bacterium]
MQLTPGTSLAQLAALRGSCSDAELLRALGTCGYFVVFPWDDGGGGGVDTCMLPDLEDPDHDPLEETVLDEETDQGVFGATRVGSAAAPAGDPQEAVLVPLLKSARNPFTQFLTVGRARNNDVILTAPSVSKVHAWLSHAGPSGWFLMDNASTNGTTQNGTRLPPRQNVPLRVGDSLGFGGALVVFADPPKVLEFTRAGDF